MASLLNLVYLLLLLAASPWLFVTSWRTGKYRHGWPEKLLGRVPPRAGSQTCVWLHAVSVGEVNLLSGLIHELALRRPDIVFVISTTTRTGYELACQKYADHHVCYCPLDFSWAVKQAFRRLRPDLLVLAELELWPNLIRTAVRRDVPVIVVNGRLSEASWRGYRRLRPFVARMVRQLAAIAVQNEAYAERFLDLGARPEDVHVTGSIKFDNAVTERGNPSTTRLAALAGITPQHQVFLAGSTQAPEEAIALETFQELQPRFPDLRLILVPRHPERFPEIDRFLAASGVRYVRRSEIEQGTVPPAWHVLLVDTVGELNAWWGVAKMAFVGGSMGDRGGQNMIEPAAYGAAVCFGPNTKNFRDVVTTLMQAEAAVVVRDRAELGAFLERCLSDAEFAGSLVRGPSRWLFASAGRLHGRSRFWSDSLSTVLLLDPDVFVP